MRICKEMHPTHCPFMDMEPGRIAPLFCCFSKKQCEEYKMSKSLTNNRKKLK